jgi:tetratricopeptide (TPR) repeat protein
MKHSKVQPDGAGYIVLRQIQAHEWLFEFPRLSPEVQDVFHTAIDEMREDPAYAKKVMRGLIRSYPEHIDAYHHLALTWYWQGKLQKAAEIWRQGSEFALKFFPPNFSAERDRVGWGFIENRPFLRLYQGYGLSCLRVGKPREALEVFEHLLRMNPNDNQGNRALAVKCNFLFENPAAVISICDRYPTDAMEQLVYGRALALFQLKRLAQAQKALRQALGLFPLIAVELLKSRHLRPEGWNEQRITMGGKDQAYAYWQEQGKFWERTPGAMAWLRKKSGKGEL